MCLRRGGLDFVENFQKCLYPLGYQIDVVSADHLFSLLYIYWGPYASKAIHIYLGIITLMLLCIVIDARRAMTTVTNARLQKRLCELD